MLNLVVKNFGVLKNIDINLNETNLFIGDNGSGKSTLAKLITVVTDLTLDEASIIRRLEDFNINFINEECFIELKEDDLIIMQTIGSNVDISKKRKNIFNELKEIESKIEVTDFINILEDTKVHDKLINKEYYKKLIEVAKQLNTLKSKYIPAERNLISFFNQSLSNIISANIPFPKTLLEFSAEYNNARNETKELELLNVKYKYENSQDKIYYKDDNSLTLENSSSGIQSALPLYMTLKYFAAKHSDIIIEEPELNLYPKSQIDTVKYIIENREESSLTIMTHSPYILSILNVLLFAYKASNTNNTLKDKISAIIPESQQINPDEFSSYLIEGGVSKSIKGKSTGMIQENVIDDIGGMLDEQFAELMEIFREFKSDK